LSLAAPIVGLSLVCCGISAWMNLEVAPKSRVAFKALLLEAGIRQPNALLPEGQFVKNFPDTVVYVGKNDGRNLKDVLVYLTRDETNNFMQITAPRGEFWVDSVKQQLHLRLYDARSLTMLAGIWHPQFGGEWAYELDLRSAIRSGKALRVSYGRNCAS
jgi:lipopolysaccharide export LptBFGC system permease protein LptF